MNKREGHPEDSSREARTKSSPVRDIRMAHPSERLTKRESGIETCPRFVKLSSILPQTWLSHRNLTGYETGEQDISRMFSRVRVPLGHRPLPRAVRSEPFQLFVLHQGRTVEAQNPGSRPSDIMSRLGHMWQALPEEQKQFYAFGALSAMNEIPRRRRPAPTRIGEPLPREASVHELIQQEDKPERTHPPRFFPIVPRAGFGQAAAIACQNGTPARPASQPQEPKPLQHRDFSS
jgi:hypothetical protein